MAKEYNVRSRVLIVLLGLAIFLAAALSIALTILLIWRWTTPAPVPTLDPRVLLTVTPIPTAAIQQMGARTQPTVAAPTPEPSPTPANPEHWAHGVVKVQTQTVQGSGFVWSSEVNRTVIVTVAHLVAGESIITIIAPDGTKHVAQATFIDEFRDVAVLEAGAIPGLLALPRGSSRELGLGTTLLVLGYPLGTELTGDLTVTKGILSSRRTLEGITYLQTDAALNPGNSGGPVLDEQGRVVGMAVGAIRWVNNLPIEGLNFALAVEEIVNVVRE